MELIKIFKAELLKLAGFMFCFGSSLVYFMVETKTDMQKLFNHVIKTITY